MKFANDTITPTLWELERKYYARCAFNEADWQKLIDEAKFHGRYVQASEIAGKMAVIQAEIAAKKEAKG